MRTLARRPTTRPSARNGYRLRSILVLAVVSIPVLASPASAADTVLVAPASVADVIENLRGWLIGLLVALATLFLTVGGVRYLSADGDPGEVERAKRSLRNAAIGYALAALAPLIVSVLQSLVG